MAGPSRKFPALKATALPTMAGEAGNVLGRAASNHICHLLREGCKVCIYPKYNQELSNWYNLLKHEGWDEAFVTRNIDLSGL
jgi:hypothetical protein